MRIVVALPIYVHRNRVIEDVFETKFLKMTLYSIDVKINHHLFESAIGPLEPKIEILSVNPFSGRFRCNEWALDEPGLFEIAQDDFRICFVGKLGLVVERCVVQGNDRIGIEHAALSIDESEQIVFLDDLARFSINIDLP